MRQQTRRSVRSVSKYLLAMSTPKDQRVYVRCPYEERQEVKSAGAHWDATQGIRMWWFSPFQKHVIKGRWKIATNPHRLPSREGVCSSCDRAKTSDGILVCRACLERDKVRTTKAELRHKAPPVTLGTGGVILTQADLTS